MFVFKFKEKIIFISNFVKSVREELELELILFYTKNWNWILLEKEIRIGIEKKELTPTLDLSGWLVSVVGQSWLCLNKHNHVKFTTWSLGTRFALIEKIHIKKLTTSHSHINDSIRAIWHHEVDTHMLHPCIHNVLTSLCWQWHLTCSYMTTLINLICYYWNTHFIHTYKATLNALCWHSQRHSNKHNNLKTGY